MKLFSPSNRSLTRDDIRVVNLRRVLLPGLVVSLVLSLGGFAGGLWVGRGLAPEALATADEPLPAEERFAIARVGELVGRLKSLESDVLSLRQMLGEHKQLTQRLSALDPSLLPALLPDRSATGTASGQGGLLLPPRGCSARAPEAAEVSLEDLPRSVAAARCLRSELDRLMESVASRNAALMAIPSQRPVAQARLGSSFGNRLDPFNRHLAFHSGVDFSIHSGAAVLAAAGGRVRFAGRQGGYGQLLEIDHGNGLVTRYAHLLRFHVRAGELVIPGQRIAEVGSTGRSTGPHLHFEVLHHGRFVDPQRFLALGDLERDASAVAND
ncbi:M23 family metallopeptidase [Pseudomonas oryzae]|uniref:Peptidase family M23 n=1 Tax=Pseudomonas oryzae TaxID=1392877 RepID=A0A1H1LA09_9PSED|nr:M23 family metallopeptidase [Pseudomonas oryzae]SDR71424.1 Peptidase family M23 [Pseudomonas oryzae]